MITHTLEKVQDIHKLLNRYIKSSKFKFRGQSDKDWKLIPKAGRAQFQKVKDIEIFRNWKRRAIQYIVNNDFTEWDYLAIAQHTALPTRLLDWSHNPLTAAFFAANENNGKDGVIFALKPNGIISAKDCTDPFKLAKGTIKFFQPSTSSLRVANQFGYFSIHNSPSLELNETQTELVDKMEKNNHPKRT